ncbi:hypothetical protein U1Q18_001285 [Sarracenia purpurea var. burkii]
MLGIYLQISAFLLTVVRTLPTLIYVLPKPILILMGQSNEISSAAALFVHGLIDPLHLRLRHKLPDTKISSVPEYCVPERLHISHNALPTRRLELGFGVQSWTWAFGRGPRAQPVLVDSGGPICLYSVEPKVMTIANWVVVISMALNAAASVRVGNELGASQPKAAAFCVTMVNLVSFLISAIEAILVLALRNVIICLHRR